MLTNPLPPPQSDSETNCSEEEAEESSSQEVPPGADSNATLLPTGEIAPEDEVSDFGGIDTFYSLKAELPASAFYEIDAILKKYEKAKAIHILHSNRSHLDVMSLEA